MARASALVLVSLLLATAAWGGPPPERQCPSVAGIPGGLGSDAVPVRLREGMLIDHGALLSLRDLVPKEIWSNRHVFFFQGMRMEIGACHRRYPVPRFFREATERHADGVGLDEKGNLVGYVAGLPFPPEKIDMEARDAAIRWAWNLAYRFRGAGPSGSFRLTDLAARFGPNLTSSGSFFLLQTRHRADLVDSGYRLPEADEHVWIAGGRFEKPSTARHLAWRQMRPQETEKRYAHSDDTFVYVPTMRKVRRAAASWIDGMYLPRYRVAGDSGGGGIAIGGNEWTGPQGAVNPTAAMSVHQTEFLPRGFLTVALRPNAYVWRVRGEREVLAPINSAWPGYPISKEKNFGPQGLSVASDRWDVRWAVVLEGKPYPDELDFETVTIYVDWQTQQPLFWITKGKRGRVLDVGIPVHRFSDDVMNYPEWPGGEPASVFDPVAEVFYRAADDSGWRRESYDVRSLPPDPRKVPQMVSTSELTRGK